jgi:hypothetical protein
MKQADEAISDLVDRLVAVAKALPPDVAVTRGPDGVTIEGPRLKLMRIANPTLRDLIGTGLIDPGEGEP